MGAVLGKEELFAEKKEKNQEGRVNMCPAVQGFYDEGRMAGIEEGRIAGLTAIARRNFQKGVSVDTIAELLDESKERILQWINEE